MNILIFGASGKTGHELVKQGLALNHRITAFVRNPDKLLMVHENLKIIQGDILNYQQVDEAVKGKDAVFSALGASSPFKFDQVVVDGVGNIIKVMVANHVNRLIYMSFIGLKDSRNAAGFIINHIAPTILSTEIAGHQERENMIKQSSLEWTIVRACTLTNGIHKGVYRTGENISSKGIVVSISRADVADCMLAQLKDNHSIKKTVRVMY
jgi:putative NADH-flavin reductase